MRKKIVKLALGVYAVILARAAWVDHKSPPVRMGDAGSLAPALAAPVLIPLSGVYWTRDLFMGRGHPRPNGGRP